ncbi:GNAT family N-acetyltransferase [Xaviernesmea oryzae]|uniref:GNAT family N-acetyltransferase n=1 Tax=Xaviernesmea oryzae TaxID=464029 RepID=A0A1Q9AVG0_9HYPH|nr:GNAT family protein [Xaviernesmea oryzae]OLP59419.1 GNAT family N-acetyltransferase [Xaviernesmea oryzae]SEL60797.1 Acetyltransferase (GNAT) family protein [Xaviernesmea oryzae]
MSAEAITIEPIREGLIEGFHRALDVVARERRYLIFLEAPPLDGTRDFVRDNIANGHPQMVAVAAGEVVGWCDIRREGRPARSHCGILGMGIIPDFRNQGLGKRLILRTIEAAWAAGMQRIELTCHHDNPRAAALYRKVGFCEEGLLRKAARIDGHFIDLIQMGLLRSDYDAVPSSS